MALNPKLSASGRNAALNAALDVLNGGSLRVYDGTQPADPDTAITSQVLLATLPLNATAFAAASAGSKTANSITSATAVATGTATWYRFVTSGGTAVFDGSVGTATSNLIFGSVAFSAGATVSVTSFTATMAA